MVCGGNANADDAVAARRIVKIDHILAAVWELGSWN